MLRKDNWIETRQIGGRGTVNAYVINDRIAWNGKRDGIRYSLFSARVIASEEEQPDRQDLGQQPPLRQILAFIRANSSSHPVLACLRLHSPFLMGWNPTCRRQPKGTSLDARFMQRGAQQRQSRFMQRYETP